MGLRLGREGVGELKPFLLARNLTLHSDAATNYKHTYMFGPQRGITE